MRAEIGCVPGQGARPKGARAHSLVELTSLPPFLPSPTSQTSTTSRAHAGRPIRGPLGDMSALLLLSRACFLLP